MRRRCAQMRRRCAGDAPEMRGPIVRAAAARARRASRAHARARSAPQVLTDALVARRSATTGHLQLTCPKIHPIIASKAPPPMPAKGAPAAPAAALPPPREPGGGLKGPVDIRHIVPAAPADGAAGATSAAPAEVEPLGSDWSDEEEVPPLM